MSNTMRLFKIGYGYDSHRFLNDEEKKRLKTEHHCDEETDFLSFDKELIIGGVLLDDKYQRAYGPFKARSDGDVLYHAVVNALLSALGNKQTRDIGTVFPNSDQKNSNRTSADFVQKAADLVKESSYELVDLKMMLKGRPRVDLAAIEENLRHFFSFQEISPDIHLQGTSGEDMDAAGKGLGVEVFAVCFLQHAALNTIVMEHYARHHC